MQHLAKRNLNHRGSFPKSSTGDICANKKPLHKIFHLVYGCRARSLKLGRLENHGTRWAQSGGCDSLGKKDVLWDCQGLFWGVTRGSFPLY